MMDGTAAQRQQLWDFLIPLLEQYAAQTAQLPVTPELNKKEIAGFVQKYHFDNIPAPETALQHVLEGLTRYAKMFFCTCVVPPPMVRAGANRNP